MLVRYILCGQLKSLPHASESWLVSGTQRVIRHSYPNSGEQKKDYLEGDFPHEISWDKRYKVKFNIKIKSFATFKTVKHTYEYGVVGLNIHLAHTV